MSVENMPKQKCTFKGYSNEGIPLEGYDLFICDACSDELDRCLVREYNKRILKRIARHTNN